METPLSSAPIADPISPTGEPYTIGLALSGGGFRATLFHIGVLQYLQERNLLPSVKIVTAVSGGSFLAAHLGVNWERYTSTREDFDRCVNEVLKLTRSDLRGRVIRRWLCGWLLVLPRLTGKMTLSSSMVHYVDEFFAGATLKSLKGNKTAPDVQLMSTSLTTGALCKFTSEGFTVADGRHKEPSVRTSSVPIALAVSASAAFPPLFPPVEVSRKTLNADSRDFDLTHYLTDGGIYDNLGLEEIKRLLGNGCVKANTLLISDAGGNFDWSIDEKYSRLISRNVRAMDILMDRMSKLVPLLSHACKYSVSHIYIGEELPVSSHFSVQEPEIQRSVRNIRTDLDAFSEQEICIVMRHGYSVAAHSFKPAPSEAIAVSCESRTTQTVEELRIDDARKRRVRLFSSQDPYSLLLMLLLCLWLSLPVTLMVRGIVAQHRLHDISAQLVFLTVSDPEGMPIANAEVRMQSVSGSDVCFTSDYGRCILHATRPERARVAVSVAGKVLSEQSVELTPGGNMRFIVPQIRPQPLY